MSRSLTSEALSSVSYVAPEPTSPNEPLFVVTGIGLPDKDLDAGPLLASTCAPGIF
jgi:hypothetical protein